MTTNTAAQPQKIESVSILTPIEIKHPLTLAQIIVLQLAELQTHYATVLVETSVEAIHKMRVTTRRLQASLDLIKFDDDTAGVGEVRKQLRTLRQMLSEVRNYDVFLTLLEQEAATRKAAKESFESLTIELQKRRAKKAKEMCKYLKKHSIKKIAKALEFKSYKPEKASLRHIADEQQIALHAAGRLEKRLAEFQQLAIQIDPSNHPEEIHQVRIAAKRLRYLLEIAADMGYGQSLTALNWLRALQDRIGDWHDLEAMEDEVINIVAQRGFVKAHLSESSLILLAAVHLQKKKESLIRRLFPLKVNASVSSASLRIINAIRNDELPGA